MKIILGVALICGTSAFHVIPSVRSHNLRLMAYLQDAETPSAFDIQRAKQCAENPGQCSVEELRTLHSQLHEERLETFGLSIEPNTYPASESLEHLALEEELEAQLNMLWAETPDSRLFPEDGMAELPHLKEDGKKDNNNHEPNQFLQAAEIAALEQEATLDGEALETIVICSAIAGLVVLPQFFHLF